MEGYQIHNLLSISSNVKLPIPSRFLASVADADVTILRTSLKAKVSALDPIGLRFYRGKNCITYKTLDGALVKLTDLNGKTVIEFTRLYEILRGIKELIEYVIYLKLVQRDYAFVHSSCVAIKDEGILIIGLSDLGKSSCAVQLAREGFSFLSDDKTILGDRCAYSYPRIIRISKTFWRPLTRRLLFLGNISVFYDIIHPEDFACWADMAPPKWVFVLDIGPNDKVVEINPNEASNSMEIATKSSYSPTMENIFSAYSYLHPTFDFIELRDRHLKIVKRALKKAECFKLVAPRHTHYPDLVKRVIGYS